MVVCVRNRNFLNCECERGRAEREKADKPFPLSTSTFCDWCSNSTFAPCLRRRKTPGQSVLALDCTIADQPLHRRPLPEQKVARLAQGRRISTAVCFFFSVLSGALGSVPLGARRGGSGPAGGWICLSLFGFLVATTRASKREGDGGRWYNNTRGKQGFHSDG